MSDANSEVQLTGLNAKDETKQLPNAGGNDEDDGENNGSAVLPPETVDKTKVQEAFEKLTHGKDFKMDQLNMTEQDLVRDLIEEAIKNSSKDSTDPVGFTTLINLFDMDKLKRKLSIDGVSVQVAESAIAHLAAKQEKQLLDLQAKLLQEDEEEAAKPPPTFVHVPKNPSKAKGREPEISEEEDRLEMQRLMAEAEAENDESLRHSLTPHPKRLRHQYSKLLTSS